MDQDQEIRSPPKDRRSNPDTRDNDRRRRNRSHSDSGSARDVDRKDRRHRRRRYSPATDDSENSSEDDRRRRRKSHRHRPRSRSRDREGRHRHDDRKYRHRSRSDERSRHHRRSRSRSPPSKRRRHSRDNDSRDTKKSPSPHKRSRAPLPSQNDSFKDTLAPTPASGPAAPDKQKPNFNPTGLLAKEANTVAGTTTVLKYHEPPEARKPPAKDAWRMYVFKGADLVDTILLHTRSAWLVGRDAKVTDYALEHPSVSKQHAVLQFRHLTRTDEYGEKRGRVRPYVIDLESANGTRLNGRRVDASRFVELVDGDVVKFGESEREYVMMLPEP